MDVFTVPAGTPITMLSNVRNIKGAERKTRTATVFECEGCLLDPRSYILDSAKFLAHASDKFWSHKAVRKINSAVLNEHYAFSNTNRLGHLEVVLVHQRFVSAKLKSVRDKEKREFKI